MSNNYLYLLSKGVLPTLESGLNRAEIILQVISYSVVASERGKIVVSDGENSCVAFLSQKAQGLAAIQKVSVNALIRSDQVARTRCGDSETLVILRLDVLIDGEKVGKILGNPWSLRFTSSIANVSGANSLVDRAIAIYSSPMPNRQSSLSPNQIIRNTPTVRFREVSSQSHNSLGLKRNQVRRSLFQSSQSGDMFDNSQTSSQLVQFIESLNLNVQTWKIKAKVITKSPIESCTKGPRFIVNLADQTGEIRCTAFNDDCARLYQQLQVGNVYYVSQGTIIRENTSFNSNFNQLYCIIFNKNTEVASVTCQECTNNIPDMVYNFIRLDHVASLQLPAYVDVIGIVTSVRLKTTQTGEKKDIRLLDVSRREMLLTLWDEWANFPVSENRVLAIKSAKVTTYLGCSLKAGPATVIKIDPEIPDAQLLLDWYDESRWTVPTTQRQQYV